MGGVPCVVIILCGGLKSSLSELAIAVPELAAPATGLLTFEGELCDEAETLTEYLTAEEKASVVARAELSWDLAAEIDALVVQPLRGPHAVDAMAARLRTFKADTVAFWRGLAEVHKNDV